MTENARTRATPPSNTNPRNRRRPGLKKAQKTIQKRIKAAKKRFLKELRKCGNVVVAAERAGINPSTPYEWRAVDAAFREAFEEKRLAARESLRASMHERAMAGDTTLMIFLAKAYWPAEFRERFSINLKTNPELRSFVKALAQAFAEFVPPERLRDAFLRVQMITGYTSLENDAVPETETVTDFPSDGSSAEEATSPYFSPGEHKQIG